jgi:UDP-N-acetylglucosamine--N-acetylmuramyl-(pentapeptide) pyrophosphoryl-undecaprenol N-acetylglucosamine transferase
MLKEQQKYPILYISGGSLGSHIINETVKDSLSNLLDSVQLILQTGDNSQFKDFELLENEKLKLSKEKQSRVYITKYIDSKEIGFIFKNIDIFLGRAGANTVYEIGIFKIPSIFIPIPWVTHNEQYQNAKILKDIGLSEIINEGELTPEKLISVVKKILKKDNSINNDLLEEIFITSASKKIIDHILK